jgi:hypothetical protein
VNYSFAHGPAEAPTFLNHTTAHHHESWLAQTRDRLDKALGVEIYSARDYRRMRLHWNGCGLLLHEYCHLIHQLALTDGLANVRVRKAHLLAQVSGLYDCVRRRDWAGLEQDFDLAYAMVDCKEFFAEMSVTFWSQGYSVLDHQDPHRMLLCSPHFSEPTVVQRIDRVFKNASATVRREGHAEALQRCAVPSVRSKSTHCNKFYPFTRGQLRFYDRSTFEMMQELWEEIESWKDPCLEEERCRC